MAAMKVEAVDVFRTYLEEMLTAAGATPRTDAIEPPIQKADIASILDRLHQSNTFPSIEDGAKKSMQYAIIETAVRDAFVALLVRTLDLQLILNEECRAFGHNLIENVIGNKHNLHPLLHPHLEPPRYSQHPGRLRALRSGPFVLAHRRAN